MLLELQQTLRVSSYSCISEGVVHLCLTGNLAGDEAMSILKIAHAIFGFYYLCSACGRIPLSILLFCAALSVQVRVVDHAVF